MSELYDDERIQGDDEGKEVDDYYQSTAILLQNLDFTSTNASVSESGDRGW